MVRFPIHRLDALRLCAGGDEHYFLCPAAWREVTNAFTEHVWYGTPVSSDLYDPLIFHPAYLIIGSFVRWTGIYSGDLLEQKCTLVKSIGEYYLYEVNTDEEK